MSSRGAIAALGLLTVALLATAWSRQAQVMLVLDAATHGGREWVKVLLAKRPNGSTGWIPRDRVALSRTSYWIEVRKRARQVTIYRDGRRLRRLRGVPGAPTTPTPVGLAAIYERNRQPNPRGALGPWALSLTSLSDVLKSFGGGPGRIAIHGSVGAGLVANSGSHGCIRIRNEDVSWLAARIPAGTPVDIRP
jgi:lipoprotein-anchoring transpeptidase ErfK/SrfK